VVKDLIAVGCGIIGATVSRALTARGMDVLTLDDGRPLGGTAPSGGHLRPSWFRGMARSDYEPALSLLDEVWGLLEEEFVVAPLGLSASIARVDTDKVMAHPRTVATVTGLRHLDNYPVVVMEIDGAGGKREVREERCRLLLLATGAWAGELVAGTAITPKQGVSFRLPGTLSAPFVRPWAPYRQVVGHQQAPGEVWVGDGSAVLPSNWAPSRTAACLERCRRAARLPNVSPSRTLFGLRPYCTLPAASPCLLKRLGPRAWLATGAGKLGTIAAGWVARRLIDAHC